MVSFSALDGWRTSSPHTQEEEAEESDIRSYPELHIKFKATLGYKRPSHTNKQNEMESGCRIPIWKAKSIKGRAPGEGDNAATY